MAINYRQSGVEYRDSDYQYQGLYTAPITAAITGTAALTTVLTVRKPIPHVILTVTQPNDVTLLVSAIG